MDLTKLFPMPEEYNLRESRKRSLEVFSALSEDARISKDQWKTLLKIGDQTYFTEIEDADYIQVDMELERLDSFSDELTRDIINALYRYNWIVQLHIKDYVKTRGLMSEE